MKLGSWLAVGVGVGLVVYLVKNAPVPQSTTGSTDVERAAIGSANWGTKQRVRGAGGRFVGRVKESVGNFAGSGELADQGVGDQIVGGVKSAVGQVAEAAGQTLHDLNR